MKKPHRLNIRVASAMLRQLEREARGHGVTMTAIIETALQRYFDTEERDAAHALGQRRFDYFIEQVARKISSA